MTPGGSTPASRTATSISVHYDPMIAKVIAYGADRAAALATFRDRLDRTAVFGVANNLPLLRAIAAHRAFAAGDVDTGFVDRELAATHRGRAARTGGARARREPGAGGAQAAGRIEPIAVVARADGWRAACSAVQSIGLRSPGIPANGA